MKNLIIKCFKFIFMIPVYITRFVLAILDFIADLGSFMANTQPLEDGEYISYTDYIGALICGLMILFCGLLISFLGIACILAVLFLVYKLSITVIPLIILGASIFVLITFLHYKGKI